ncbi:hypothetical protein [Luteitalea sp.]|uniref:hypothetical protein n=1 Tax=Luteitalea sp. TaxID=2004800 RepID=UPI0025B96F57|nr:hypothetical protein [Luteitalea sp.]
MLVTTPYRYLIGPGDDVGAELVDDLCRWHDRMVAHVRRHGASARCGCGDPDDCPRIEARELWHRARTEFGVDAAPLTFLRQHGGGDVHG